MPQLLIPKSVTKNQAQKVLIFLDQPTSKLILIILKYNSFTDWLLAFKKILIGFQV